MDYAENIVQLLADLTALLMCLFHYIGNKRRAWLYGILFFLSSLLSCYYWTNYLVIMGDSPNVSDLMAYTGWNMAFAVLLVLLIHLKPPEERRYFHPLMLLPLPLNVWQFILYLPYGTFLNNLYQVGLCTLISVFGIQGLCWYRKKRGEGAAPPWVSLGALVFSTAEFGMWTTSCFYPPVADLYFPFSFLSSINYLFLVWAIRRTVEAGKEASVITFDRKYQNILRAASLGMVLLFSVGGLLLGMWMRNTIPKYISPDTVAEAYDIIPVVLFVISLILIAFVVAVIFVVYFGQRAAGNRKLREARQIAERSSAAKSEFLANMSHEIRTPINAVMGMNEIILRESRAARDSLVLDPGRVRGVFSDICGYSGVIESAGKSLLSIINDILDISRIEAGKLQIREDSYLLSSLLNDLCHLTRFRAQSKDLAFEVDVDERIPDRLFGDEVRVRQVVLNLLNNAVKYTGSGSVTLSVSCGSDGEPKEGQTVDLVFCVRDTGIGIRPEDLDRLFDKFERIGMVGQTSVEGTGLGLAICRTLTDMMGGAISVESAYGAGSAFTVTLPQKVVSPRPIGRFRETYDAGAENAAPPPRRFRAPEARILVVDDTRMNLTVIEGLLNKSDIRIDTADSGEAALRLTRSVAYDLILMDQRMPVMDGTEALRRVRSQEDGACRSVPVVCLTADAIAGAKERYLAEGFADYLSKPVDSRSLYDVLLRLLPPEKVLFPSEEEDPAPAPAASAAEYAALRDGGIDAGRGLMFCQQDGALYRSLLLEFARASGDRLRRMEQAVADSVWKNYALDAHSLKSTSATIGAAVLSDAAARLEAAANNGEYEEVRRGNPILASLYKRTVDAVLAFTGEPLRPEETDEEVLEFEPEE